MNTKVPKYTYTEWFTKEEMHENLKTWFSQLSFVKDEHRFLNNLIQSFAIKTLSKQEFEKIKEFKKALVETQKMLNPIIKQVQKQMNQLEIMIDKVDELEKEKTYTKLHKKLLSNVNKYLLNYSSVKEKGFMNLSSILKKEQGRFFIGNPEYKLSKIQEEK